MHYINESLNKLVNHNLNIVKTAYDKPCIIEYVVVCKNE